MQTIKSMTLLEEFAVYVQNLRNLSRVLFCRENTYREKEMRFGESEAGKSYTL